jgi:hypothetical protein
MKFDRILLILCLATVSVAQTSTPTKADPSTGQKAVTTESVKAKANCPCCQKMADSQDAKSCCQHDPAVKGEKQAMSCCQGNDGMSCMKGDKDKSADATCANGKCCGANAKEDCCATSDKTTEQAAMACCGAAGGHCGAAHHDHGDMKE